MEERSGVGMRRWLRFASVVLVCARVPLVSTAQTALPRAESFAARLEMLALTQTLNAEILASPSATLSLEHWCRDHHMASDPRIVARVVAGVDKTPTTDQLQRLEVADARAIKYRRVELRCGSHILSEADNWYVPSRLTTEMNSLLETTDTPFGKAVQPLRPYRRTFAVTLLWSPFEVDAPTDLFEHRAVLYTSEGRPFSEVDERYQGELFDFSRDR